MADIIFKDAQFKIENTYSERPILTIRGTNKNGRSVSIKAEIYGFQMPGLIRDFAEWATHQKNQAERQLNSIQDAVNIKK